MGDGGEEGEVEAADLLRLPVTEDGRRGGLAVHEEEGSGDGGAWFCDG